MFYVQWKELHEIRTKIKHTIELFQVTDKIYPETPYLIRILAELDMFLVTFTPRVNYPLDQ